MIYVQSLREQAEQYRQLAAEQAKCNKLEAAKEAKDLAEVCEEVASEIEDHIPSG